ncbi:hydrogenase maturation nickel metallochaperone HypA [Motiliproteus sp. SC1-56]|uniref:hydrogenase maturation nickel metallochaperone HypA n=1 Tax=Motiliproteus sp. SC1-56 TaxID=2799565 RepID=UPI001A8F7D35|nr:hydrogenase maturation nickel metallochaperone HypA [Motiliproteus sp. SC1-56]
MHEMSLAEGVIQVLEESAVAQGFSRVKKVWLEIGRLSHVEAEAMRFCFEAVCKGSIAQDAELEIIEIPGTGWCHECGKQFEYQARYDPCPHCNGYQVQMVAGDEMRVKELEVE